MGFDPFLYVAFAGGFVAGRFVRTRGRWVERATIATMLVLLLLLGGTLVELPATQVLDAIPVAVLFTVLLLGLTLGFVWLLPRSARPPETIAPPITGRFPIEFVFAAALVIGYGTLGRLSVPWNSALEWALYVLLALVAFDLRISRRGLRSLWVPLTAAAAAAPIAAYAMVLAAGLSLPVSLAIATGFGWYTLAGPLVAAKVGPVLGLVAFLTNFFRENLTMLTAPRVGAHLGAEGIVALGGATAMDTTLYFATRFGRRDSANIALASGLILTLAAGLLLPVLLSLPGA